MRRGGHGCGMREAGCESVLAGSAGLAHGEIAGSRPCCELACIG